MPAVCATPESSTATSHSTETVWDRLWRYRPTDDRDDALLRREQQGPRWQMTARRLEACFGGMAGLRTIELGSGRGDLSVLLATHGAHVTLMDRSERALSEARQRFDRLGLSAQFEQGDLLVGDDRWTGAFDVSLSVGVIEHFKGDVRTRVLDTHFDVLRPGGLCVVSVPHAWCVPYRLWKSYLELRGWWPYGMEIPYCRRELTQRASQAGFVDVETRSIEFWKSVGELWCKRMFGRWPDWSGTPSRMDALMGMVLLMIARRKEADGTTT